MRNPVTAWARWLGLVRRPTAARVMAGPEPFADLTCPADWEALREQALQLFRQSVEAAHGKGDDG